MFLVDYLGKIYWTKFQIDVFVSPPNIKPRISILEHILLKIDFSYLDTVPSVNKLMFKMPTK